MMKTIFYTMAMLFSASSFAQSATEAPDTIINQVTIFQDPRMGILKTKEAEYYKYFRSGAKGFRLMVINSRDKDLVMKVRAQLLQRFPEQKIYMSFQAPYIKIKFGNFVEQTEAEKYQKMITNAKLVPTSIYLVPEVVEVKPDKNKDEN